MEFGNSIYLPQGEGSQRPQVVLFHGLTTCPRELRSLADALFAAGYSVSVPRLPGHGETIDVLAKTSEKDWLSFADAQIRAVPRDVTLYVGGLSLGGLLSLYVATTHADRISAVAALAPPLRFRAVARKWVLHFLRVFPDSLLHCLGTVAKRKKQFVVPRPEFDRHSIAAGVRLARVQRLVVKRLSLIQCPVLLLQDPEDHHVAAVSDEVSRQLKHNEHSVVEAVFGGGHELLAGPRHEEVVTRVVDFFKTIERSS